MSVVKSSATPGMVAATGGGAAPWLVPRMALRTTDASGAYWWVLGGILSLMAATIALAVAVY